MPDKRRHRGRHPADRELFAASQEKALVTAVKELSWLLSRGYSDTSAIKLVGDRHALRQRQRMAMRRCACAREAVVERLARQVTIAELSGQDVAVDGFNCLIAIEAALAGGVVLIGRDGVYRDLSSVHGSYRRVDETRTAIHKVGEMLAAAAVASVVWLLDRPVSNSGRLAALLRDLASEQGWPWEVELVDNPDRDLVGPRVKQVVASGDSWVLDNCQRWVDLPRAGIERLDAWVVDLPGRSAGS